MLLYTTESIQAEIQYRQEQLKRSYQRPGLFRRRTPKAEPPVPRPHLVRTRHAM